MNPKVPKPLVSAEFQRSSLSDVSEVRGLAKGIRKFLLRHGCADAIIADCELALVEACNNALQYAQAIPEQTIEVEAFCDAEEIELRVVDHTIGFDWPAEVTLPGPESERGRGLFLIQAVMDTTRYHRASKGNTLILRKNRHPKQPRG